MHLDSDALSIHRTLDLDVKVINYDSIYMVCLKKIKYHGVVLQKIDESKKPTARINDIKESVIRSDDFQICLSRFWGMKSSEKS